MHYCIGTDEAGYGPNLGPLVISATLWRVPDDADDDQLYPLLRKVVARTPPSAATKSRRIVLADSKAVYSPAGGLQRLEFGALACLRACGVAGATFADLLAALSGDVAADEAALPWHRDVAVALPHACSNDAVVEAADRLRAGFAAAGVELLAVRSRAVFPEEFNSLVAARGNKSDVLTAETLQLARGMLERCGPGRVSIACDKHGGRNAYAAALQAHLFDGLPQIVRESRPESAYRFADAGREVEIGFRVDGESRLPAALASMVSKYVRELAMEAFNRFWIAQLPALRPTAGYAVDSKRFRVDIEPTARRLKLDERRWWRCR